MGLAESSIIKVINKWDDREVLTKSLSHLCLHIKRSAEI